MRRKGFTLIELMIVIAIIAIIAAIAIPGLLRARIAANEGSAIGTMRTLSTSEAQFQSQSLVDQEGDGTGEFGLLGELTGSTNMRSKAMKAAPTFITRALSPALQDAWGQKSGYYFQVYLPAGTDTGAVTTDNGTNDAISLSTNANNQETKWRGYAWPVSGGTSGNRAFAIDQAAEVYATPNVDTTNTPPDPVYTGTTSGETPEYDAATLAADAPDDSEFEDSLRTGPNQIGIDWKPSS